MSSLWLFMRSIEVGGVSVPPLLLLRVPPATAEAPSPLPWGSSTIDDSSFMVENGKMTTTTDRLGKNKMGMAKIKMESQQSMLLDIAIQMGKIMNNERCFCISRSR
mmetsp:Transcript_9835/g.16118  ORF Transcript_9835/g.16118 Transcript_9835/m.16118 type:complete len:106 (+) Transcript_9835:622-939(+)